MRYILSTIARKLHDYVKIRIRIRIECSNEIILKINTSFEIIYTYCELFFFYWVQMGLTCHIKEFVRSLAMSLESSLKTELELYDSVTEEEFEVVRLSKAERKDEIIKSVNVRKFALPKRILRRKKKKERNF